MAAAKKTTAQPAKGAAGKTEAAKDGGKKGGKK